MLVMIDCAVCRQDSVAGLESVIKYSGPAAVSL